MVESLLYLVVMIHPDVVFVVSNLSKPLLNPGPASLPAVEKELLYLYMTRYLAIQYKGEYKHSLVLLLIVSDMSFIDDLAMRQSSQ
jgi:hypothetical protein